MGGRTKEGKANADLLTPPPPTPQPEFHFFPLLPIELRQEILGHAIPEPRTVTIWSARGGGTGREIMEMRRAGPTPVPTPLLHVSREIREFAEQWYTLSFGEQLKGRAICFDFKRDTLRMSHGKSIERLYGVSTSKVPESRLAHMADIEAKVRFLSVYNNFRSPIIGLISRFHNLETLNANYDIKPHSERLLIKQMTKRATDNGWELKIPKFSVNGGPLRELQG